MPESKNQEPPKVSIVCNFYNHERFIDKAIKSFIIQKTDFNFEILAHDDASIDSTSFILEEYCQKFPELIKPIFQTENKGQKGKNIWIEYQFPRTQGKYIAICDGDDYWTDTLKLQKQVDFLEANPEYSLCFHDVEKLYDDGRRQLSRRQENIPFDTEYLIRIGRPCHTCSILFRRDALDLQFMAEGTHFLSGDIALLLNISQTGPFARIPENMGVYRIHSNGITKNEVWKQKWMDSYIELLNFFDVKSNSKYHGLINDKIDALLLAQLQSARGFKAKVHRLSLSCQERPNFFLKHIDKISLAFFWWFIHKTKLYYLKRWAKRLIGAKKMV